MMNRTAFDVIRIHSENDPVFEEGFLKLDEEFGHEGYLEAPEVLARRLAWDPSKPRDAIALLYEMILVRRDGAFAGVRDHTAIVPLASPHRAAVVHLSHNLVAPEWRRSGLAGWLRAFPLATARDCLRGCGGTGAEPATLVGEMEEYDPVDAKRVIRLKAYEKAGFLKVDPARIHYRQPDFRDPEVIDASGGPKPIPLCLIVRRAGREQEAFITGAEVRHLVTALYGMYAAEFRARDMEPLWHELKSYPPDEAKIPLLKPTEPGS
jgi:GNAT superfamily N-acetyltransferase